MDDKTCVVCNSTFTPSPRGGTHQVTCSEACRRRRRLDLGAATNREWRARETERRRREARAAEIEAFEAAVARAVQHRLDRAAALA